MNIAIIKTLGKWALISSTASILLGCNTEYLAQFDRDKEPLNYQIHNKELLNHQGPGSYNTGLEKPPVSLGDIFVYDNPVERFEVTRLDDSHIYWQRNTSDFGQTTWSTLLPSISWYSSSNAGRRSLEAVSGQIHPLKTGNTFSFIEKTIRDRSGRTYRSQWECVVQKQVEIVVSAGKSNTWQVLCSVNGRERAVFNYSEKIGNLIRSIILTDSGEKIERQLTAYARGKQQ